MNEMELKSKIVNDFQALVSDIASAETLQLQDNPFSTVTFSKDFLEAQLNSPVLSDDELKELIKSVDKAIEESKSLKEVTGLISTGLKLLAKYGVIL